MQVFLGGVMGGENLMVIFVLLFNLSLSIAIAFFEVYALSKVEKLNYYLPNIIKGKKNNILSLVIAPSIVTFFAYLAFKFFWG
jgi:hypothetical protein